jgi:hypothetical protein
MFSRTRSLLSSHYVWHRSNEGTPDPTDLCPSTYFSMAIRPVETPSAVSTL